MNMYLLMTKLGMDSAPALHRGNCHFMNTGQGTSQLLAKQVWLWYEISTLVSIQVTDFTMPGGLHRWINMANQLALYRVVQTPSATTVST